MSQLHYFNLCITYLLALLLVDAKVVQVEVLPEENCGILESFKSSKIECSIKRFKLVAMFQIGGPTVPFLIDTGSALSWVLTNRTLYRSISKHNTDKIVRQNYGRNWTNFFHNPPSDLSVPGNRIGAERHTTTYSGVSTVSYDIHRTPIEIGQGDWKLNLKIGLAVCVSNEDNFKRRYSGLLGLKYYPSIGRPMVSFDINLTEGRPTSPSYVGFGQSVMPNGMDRRNVISVTSVPSDWIIEIKYIKLHFPDMKLTFHGRDGRNALLDTGASMIRLPEEIKNSLTADKRNFTFGEEFPCNQLKLFIPTVHLGISNSDIRIPPESLYFKRHNLCKSMLRTIEPLITPITQRPRHMLFGLAFFASVYTEFHFPPDPSHMTARVQLLSKSAQ